MIEELSVSAKQTNLNIDTHDFRNGNNYSTN